MSARCALTTKLAAPASICCWSPLGVRYALVSLMRVDVRSLAGGGGGGGGASESAQLQQESAILCCVFLSETIVATGGADGVVCLFCFDPTTLRVGLCFTFILLTMQSFPLIKWWFYSTSSALPSPLIHFLPPPLLLPSADFSDSFV